MKEAAPVALTAIGRLVGKTKMTRTRRATTDRLMDIANIFNAMPEGEMIGQQQLMTKLGMGPGQWKGIRKMLDVYVMIQSSSRIERHFMPNGKLTNTKYKVASVVKAVYPQEII